MKSAKLALAALVLPASASLLALTGCGSEPSSQVEVRQLVNDGNATIKDMEIADPPLADDLKKAVGYVVFPNVESGALFVKASSGNGEVFQGGNYIGSAALSVGGVGASVGGESYSELIIFQTPQALSDFENNKLSFDANASAVVLQAGATTPTKYTNGVAVVKHVKGGLMLDASIGGQQLTFKAANPQPATQPTP
jgi:lipid-binding SYLF domain-containing protein